MVAGISWLGVLFKQLLLLIIYPLVLASIFIGMVGLGDIRKTGKMAGQALAWFMTTTALSVALGMVLVNLYEPGVGFQIVGEAVVLPDALVQTTPGEFFLNMLKNTIKNPFASLANGDVLGIIMFALLLGGVASTMGEAAKPMIDFFDALNRALMKLTELVMWIAPLGVLALLSEVVEQQGIDTLIAMWRYMKTVLTGLFIHGIIILPGLAWLVGGGSSVAIAARTSCPADDRPDHCLLLRHPAGDHRCRAGKPRCRREGRWLCASAGRHPEHGRYGAV